MIDCRTRSLLALVVMSCSVAALTARPASADVSLGGWMAHSPDDISGFTSLTGNDSTVDVGLPFTFTIEGVGYTTVAISTNGWIEFGGNTSGNSDPTNDCLPTSAHSNPFLAAYWDDLVPFGSNVRYGMVGNSPNRVFIVDLEADVLPSNQDHRYQVQLHEGSNLITVRYRDTQNQANGQGATIGFQGAGGGAATAHALTCNAKILDDNRPDEGWSADVGRAGNVVIAANTELSPDDLIPGATLSGNDNTATVGLGFNVTIEGNTYSTVTLSTNGWIEFGGNTSGNSDPTNDCLPTAAHTNPFLAALWDDMETFGTNIGYGTLGTSPNRVFVADYEFEIVSGVEGSDDTHMQVEIHEGSSLINVRYRDKQRDPMGQFASIGFQGAGGASAAAHGLTCDGRILDDDDDSREGWSVDPRRLGKIAVHGVFSHSPNDITGFTTLSGNDNVTTVVLPFSVTVDGTSYGSVAISTNGWLELGGNTSGDSDPSNDCLPTGAHSNPFVAFYWDDIQTQGTNIRYGTVGTSPNRTFVVDGVWDVVAQGGSDVLAGQVQIHEGSNIINVKYRQSDVNASGTAATIGFQRAGGASATAHPLVCNGRILDDNRTDSGWSVAPLPVCGNGLLEGAGGEICDLGGANGSATSCCTTSCGYRAGGATCRVGGGAPCDLNETCTGSSQVCPIDDAPTNAGITCRLGSNDECDPDELCTGTPGQACPADVLSSSSTECRAGSGDVCDPAENCTGVPGQQCPANVLNGGSTVCRIGAGDACDTSETCSGVPTAPCPPDDAPINLGMVCRAGSGDVCDVNETCTGVAGQTCPSDDAPGKAGFICRLSTVGDFCDESETCSGVAGTVCPADDVPGKINVVCRAGSGDLCDPDERCTGIVGQGCPANQVANPTTVCRAGSGDSCDPDELCTAVPNVPCPADVVTPGGTTCRAAADVCDVSEACSGIALQTCPANQFAPATTACDDDANQCTTDECDGNGTCEFAAPLDCEDGNVCTQDSCVPATGCVSSGTPALTCRPATKASFSIKDHADPPRDQLKFNWKGGPVLLNELGDPTQTTRYELCIYDSSGGPTALGVAPVGGWSTIGSSVTPRGYKYKDLSAPGDGVRKMTLKGSSLDKGKLKLNARGENIPEFDLPFQLPVRVQLYTDEGFCWDAEFETSEARKNSDQGFRATQR